MNRISIINATYKGEYRLKICFNDKEEKIVDFGPFLENYPHPQYNAYKDKQLFQSFKIENGNVVWGQDWDLIFPVADLYRGVLNPSQPHTTD